ncbi:MAG: winged helix-turn-helix domain-containing protein [Sneathiella sp.]
MKEGPDIAQLGSLIGDPARANMLNILLNGKALTATELALEAGITPQTASSHLKKLEQGNLLRQRKQGRHRYFSLADEDVATLLENIQGFIAKQTPARIRTGPKDPALRRSRVCYNHLAGELAVHLFDSLKSRHLISGDPDGLTLTDTGVTFFQDFGIDIPDLQRKRRPLCRSCLDWSMRRSHLAGSLGTALLDQFYSLKWARREEGSRIITFSKAGEKSFKTHFPVLEPQD